MSDTRPVWFLDTETTGFLHNDGDRVIEIGAIQYLDRVPTGKTFHVYLDPQRDVPEEAYAVHSLSRDDLVKLSKGKVFRDVAHEMIKALEGCEMIAHNATFDVNFLDAELKACGLRPLTDYGVVITDSLQVANAKYPGQSNSLDALLKRLLGTNNYEREFHGALLDASLLARVYLLMTVQQNKLGLDATFTSKTPTLKNEPLPPMAFPLLKLDDADMARHNKLMERISKESKKIFSGIEFN
jgi:DNA polymerase-3 subunit epsilon